MIINSILDNDMYKFSMQQAVCQLYPRAEARYEFINRGGTKFPPDFDFLLYGQIRYFSELKLTGEEKWFLKNICYYLQPPYIDFLAGYRYDPNEVSILLEGGDLKITIEGPWYRAILWEVPLLALISELYFLCMHKTSLPGDLSFIEKAKDKARRLKLIGVKFSDFGTRRRYSKVVQEEVIKQLKEFGMECFSGTSNVYFAKANCVKPIGTQAHEWYMFHAAKFGFRSANKVGMEQWVNVYKGDLGIALADTFTSDSFFESFNTQFAKLFDGVRQDSGDPFEFIEKTIKRYRKLGIDPRDKTIVFSDNLNVDLVEKIHDSCKGRIRDAYGIGTNFTNDVGVSPLNMVIKMAACRDEGEWMPACKLSDVPTKYTGDFGAIELAKKMLNLGQ